MARKSGAVALTVLSVGFALASCAFQSNSAAPVTVQEDRPAFALDQPTQQEAKKFSAIGSDADCVLTTGDIHFWCKWITRYY